MDLMKKYLSRVKLEEPSGNKAKNQNGTQSVISSDILDDMLFTVIRRTKEYSIKIVRDYVRNHHKDVDDGITEISAEVSKVYKACKEGKASLDDFKAVLEPYHNICAKAIELYKNEKGRIKLT